MKTIAINIILTAVLLLGGLAVLAPQAHGQGGVPLWTNRYSSAYPRSVAVDNNGNVFVTGTANGNYPDYITIKYSAAGAPLWTNRYNGPGNGFDTPVALAVDSSGNVFVTGNSDYVSGGGAFYATIKYSAAGMPLWTNFYNSVAGCYCNNFASGMAVDRSGNVFVTGRSYVGGGNGLDDYTTIAYSGAGTPLWTNRYDGPGNADDGAQAITVDGNGNVFVTGYVYRNSDFTSLDFATVAYSNTGEPLWTNLYNGPADAQDQALAVAVDGNGSVFVTGFSWNGSDSDYATLAYSNSGVPLWTNRYNAPGDGDDSANSITVDTNGNVFVTGFSWNGTDYDYATLAYSNAGVPLWTNRYNGPGSGDDRAHVIAVDSGGNVFVTGSSWNGSDLDYATLAYSNAGVPLWTNRYNGPANGFDAGTALAVDASGNVLVTGSSYGSSTNSPDFATIKYSSSLAPAPRLDFQRINNQLVLSWTNAGFSLQSAPAITGTFTNIPNATSPHTNNITGPQQYFRLKAN